jgi:hypothetical protein
MNTTEIKQTAVEWLADQVEDYIGLIPTDIIKEAKEMEKQQMDKVSADWWVEGASYIQYGKRKYETFEQYYNETFGK